jgi:hypothetical protein
MFKRIALILCLGVMPVKYLFAAEPSCLQSDVAPCSEIVTAVRQLGSEKQYTVTTLKSQTSLGACGRYLSAGEAPVSTSGYAYFGRENTDNLGCSDNFINNDDSWVTLYRMDKLTTSEKYVCNQYYNESELVANGVIISGTDSNKGDCTISRQKIRKLSDGYWVCSDLAYPGYYIDKVESTTTCASNYRYRQQKIQESDTYIQACRPTVEGTGWAITGSSNHYNCNGLTRYTYEKFVGYGCTVPAGMVATSVVPDSTVGYDCGVLAKAYKLEIPSNGLSYCVGIGGTLIEDTPPEGMIVSQVSMSGDCDSRATYSGEKVTISTPAIGAIMCTKYGAVPDGFGIADIKNRSQCGGTAGLNAGGVLTGLTEGAVFCKLPLNLTGDWVIKDISNRGLCGGGYAYTIGLASRTTETDICWVNDNETSIPDDFVITNDKNSISGARCEGSATYAYKIALPSKTNYVCSLLHLPSNYGVVAYAGSTSSCAIYSYEIELIEGNGTFNVCANSLVGNEIPTGFVVTRIFNLPECGSNQAAYQLEPPKSNGITHVCQVQRPDKFPVGLVATDISYSSNCHVTNESREGYDAHYPPTEHKSVMCDGSILPAGFEYYIHSAPANCNSFTQAKYIQIIGLEDYFLDPFVYPEVPVNPSTYTPPVF